jgi:hypothetical protein
MSKRFTETTKWEDPWFRELSPAHKALWLWMLDKCDCAGVLAEIDWKLASFQVGAPLAADAMSAFESRVEPCGKGFWIRKFIVYQYGHSLRDRNPAHKGVLKALRSAKLNPPVTVEYEGPSKDLSRTLQGPKDKDKDKDKVKADSLTTGAPEFSLGDNPKLEPAKPPRARDPLFDALASATDGDPMQLTKQAKKQVALALYEIKAVSLNLTPAEIARRAENYRLHLPTSPLTAFALAKHWARCDTGPKQPANTSRLTTDIPDDEFHANREF